VNTGFIVGAVEHKRMLTGEKIAPAGVVRRHGVEFSSCRPAIRKLGMAVCRTSGNLLAVIIGTEHVTAG
jgi:hypothetical protein